MPIIRVVDALGNEASLSLAKVHPGDRALFLRAVVDGDASVPAAEVGEVLVVYPETLLIRARGARQVPGYLHVVGPQELEVEPGDVQLLLNADDPRIELLGGSPEEAPPKR